MMLDTDATAPAAVIIDRSHREGFGGRDDDLEGLSGWGAVAVHPGEIGQTGWWVLPVTVPVGKGAARPAHSVVTTLPHSATHAVVFTFTKTIADFTPAFAGTLTRLEGTPEKMVADRVASIVVPRSRPARLHRRTPRTRKTYRARLNTAPPMNWLQW